MKADLDLEINFPTDLPDLPPPQPSTEVAIEFWLSSRAWELCGEERERLFDAPWRTWQVEPFVLHD